MLEGRRGISSRRQQCWFAMVRFNPVHPAFLVVLNGSFNFLLTYFLALTLLFPSLCLLVLQILLIFLVLLQNAGRRIEKPS